MSLLRRELRPGPRLPSVRFRAPNFHIKLRWLIYGWLAVMVFRALRWLATHPRWTLVLAMTGVLIGMDLWWPALMVACLTAGALCLWWALQPGSFHRWVGRPVQLELREWFVYRRNWQPAMLTCGLTLRDSWGGDLPVLRKVRNEHGRDLLRVRMLDGQTPGQWEAARAALAQTFGVRHIRVRRIVNRPRELDLIVVRRGTPLRHVTEADVDQEPRELQPARGAFPRQPRGGAA
jgi:S-DNA-T family DNA segregation ATPase FtsK/SpoIIIE